MSWLIFQHCDLCTLAAVSSSLSFILFQVEVNVINLEPTDCQQTTILNSFNRLTTYSKDIRILMTMRYNIYTVFKPIRLHYTKLK